MNQKREKVKRGREDYLRVLFQLHHENKENKIKSADIAEKLKISKPSVSEMLRKLRKQEIVALKNYSKVKLTKKGLIEAEKCHDKHHTIRRFLQLIGHDELKAREEACNLEHSISIETLKLIADINENKPLSIAPSYVG